MPTYTVHAPAGRLSSAQKADIAREITRAHHTHTGAQRFFAQVLFNDVPPGSWYVGGMPIDGEQIYLQGQVRAGRSEPVKKALLTELAEILVAGSGFPRHKTWVYLIELPPSHMVEYGHVLPQPGTEAAWLAALPGEDRAFMQSIVA